MTALPQLISPTGLKQRATDAWGSGAWLAKRGSRLHLGVDFRTTAGREVTMPCTARIARRKHPYADDLSWSGVLLNAGGWEITLFYVDLTAPVGIVLPVGATLGVSQNIAKRYDHRMTPHVHLEVHAPSRSALPADWEEGLHWVRGPKGQIIVDPNLLLSRP